MRWEIKILEEQPRILIIAKNNVFFINLLKKKLEDLGGKVFLSQNPNLLVKKFDYIFFINSSFYKEEELPKKNVFFIFFNQSPPKLTKDKKIVKLLGNKIDEKTIEQILWFFFSKTSQKFLLLNLPKIPKKKITLPKSWSPFSFSFSFLNKKNIFIIVLLFFFLFHFLFLPPLFLSGYFFYQTGNYLKKEEIKEAKNSFTAAKNYFFLAKKLYFLSRPVYLLFSIASLPDDLISIGEKLVVIGDSGFSAYDNGKNLLVFLFKKNKTEEEKKLFALKLKNLSSQLKTINENLSLLIQKLSQLNLLKEKKTIFSSFNQSLTKFIKFYPYLEKIIENKTNQKFLILFANNMELRPGGGFIGSLGILQIKDYTFEGIEIYDVYDIDGQLTIHIDPPEPIKKYLNLNHWFLRDSNFSPDFWENYQKVKFFLEKSVGWQDFSGAILITTTAIQKILEAFPPIYLVDLKEKITKDNFYLKTQFYVEKNFFPGSIQKKSFLSSIVRGLILNIENASLKNLSLNLSQLFEEKQIVFAFEEEDYQKIIEELGWGGRLAKPVCFSSFDNCIVNFLFPYEANLGANKANFFINRHYSLKILIDSSGKITNYFTILFKNEAKDDIFPGSNYRNFFQILLPKTVSIKEIKKNGVLVEDVSFEDKEEFKKIGIFLEIPQKKTVVLEIVYKNEKPITNNFAVLQLIIQKQIGALNSDITLKLSLPKNISIINQNFFPLVKNQEIIYNSYFSTDKIFFIQLKKAYE
jgi:hypothetical protein